MVGVVFLVRTRFHYSKIFFSLFSCSLFPLSLSLSDFFYLSNSFYLSDSFYLWFLLSLWFPLSLFNIHIINKHDAILRTISPISLAMIFEIFNSVSQVGPLSLSLSLSFMFLGTHSYVPSVLSLLQWSLRYSIPFLRLFMTNLWAVICFSCFLIVPSISSFSFFVDLKENSHF